MNAHVSAAMKTIVYLVVYLVVYLAVFMAALCYREVAYFSAVANSASVFKPNFFIAHEGGQNPVNEL